MDKQTSLATRRDYKLAPNSNYVPSNSTIHPVVHVSMLKKKVRAQLTPQLSSLLSTATANFQFKPMAILNRQV